MVKLCSEILPTGSRCAQFALRGRAWCRAHATAIQRESNADARQLIEMIRGMDTFTVSATLCTILDASARNSFRPCRPRRFSTPQPSGSNSWPSNSSTRTGA